MKTPRQNIERRQPPNDSSRIGSAEKEWLRDNAATCPVEKLVEQEKNRWRRI